MGGRLAWLSVLRGLCILLVVMRHVQLVDMQTGLNHEVCSLLAMPFEPIRMPLFIFTSGGLLYLSRISKGWEVSRLYADKARRILVPLLFFVVFYYGIKALMGNFVKTPVALSWHDFLESFVIYDGHASAPLWFLATLSVLMLMYPLFCRLLRSYVATIAFFVFSVAIFFVDFTPLLPHNYFHILKLNLYLVYFYTGIVFFKYGFNRFTGRWPFLLASMAIYTVLYYFEVPIAVSLVGVVMLMSACQLVSEWNDRLFSSFRDYIYQIYLMSFFFQGVVELVLWRTLFYDERLFALFYLLNVAAGIYGPVFVSKLIEKWGGKWLKLMIGVK